MHLHFARRIISQSIFEESMHVRFGGLFDVCGESMREGILGIM